MIFLCRRCSLLLVLAILGNSCGDDPKMVEKREKQKTEIVRLQGELAVIEEKLKNLPPDVTAELAEARRLYEKQTAEVASMETEIGTLEIRKRSLQAEFESYQAKYKLK